MVLIGRTFLSIGLLLALGLQFASAANETLTELRGYKRTFKLNRDVLQLCKDKWELDKDGDHAYCPARFFFAPHQNGDLPNGLPGVDREFKIRGKLKHTVRIWPVNSGIGIAVFAAYGKKLKNIEEYSSDILKVMAELDNKITVNTVDTELRSYSKFVINDEDLGAAKIIERTFKFSVNDCIANWKPLPGPYVRGGRSGNTLTRMGYCNLKNFSGEFLPGEARNDNSGYDIPVVINGQNFAVGVSLGTYSLNISIFPSPEYSEYDSSYDVSFFEEMLRNKEDSINATLQTFRQTIVAGELQDSAREPGHVVGSLMDSQVTFPIDLTACKNSWSAREREPKEAACWFEVYKSKYSFFNDSSVEKSYSENVLWKQKSIEASIWTDPFKYDVVSFAAVFRTNSNGPEFKDFAEMLQRFSDENNGKLSIHRNIIKTP